jgi:hypothetical protein
MIIDEEYEVISDRNLSNDTIIEAFNQDFDKFQNDPSSPSDNDRNFVCDNVER